MHIAETRRFKHHQNSTRKPPQRKEKNEFSGGRGKKKRDIFALPPFGAPPTFRGSTVFAHHGKREGGRGRIWPQLNKSLGVEQRLYWPKSNAPGMRMLDLANWPKSSIFVCCVSAVCVSLLCVCLCCVCVSAVCVSAVCVCLLCVCVCCVLLCVLVQDLGDPPNPLLFRH